MASGIEEAITDLLDSAGDAGCCPDLVVVSRTALDRVAGLDLRACNAHDDLLKALERLLHFGGGEKCLCSHMRAEDCLPEDMVCPTCEAEAAIAKATAKENS